MKKDPSAVLIAAPSRSTVQAMKPEHRIDEISSLFAAIEVAMYHATSFAFMWVGRTINIWERYYVLKVAVVLPFEGVAKEELLQKEAYKYLPRFTLDLVRTLSEVKQAYLKRVNVDASEAFEVAFANDTIMSMVSSSVTSIGNDEALPIVQDMAKSILLLRARVSVTLTRRNTVN
jgi:hypothetical protein